ncbi:WSC domain-containing protein [Plectosphaerella plurivora]|uniref:WSC domain-containing protein n=1 Tax=Plectosphaerella plurivora TaxID=936078 RepID=A0A9P9A9Y1_9PEZI|nr:WSC domain-containing protein [Plectosphaerella plurivora]
MLPQCASASESASRLLGKRDVQPNLPFKAGTASDCSFWYDNWDGDSCEVVRDWIFAISPQKFSEWNPSISLDCEGWEDWHSYCVHVGVLPHLTTTTSKPPKTTTTSVPLPRPTVSEWEFLGCYVEKNTLSNQLTREDGSTLTVDKCQAACWLDGWEFAGVKSGNECWCGDMVGGNWAKEQTDCNIPCPGNGAQTCGGDKLLSVYRPIVHIPDLSNFWLSSSVTTTSAAAAMVTVAAAAATSDISASSTTSDSTASATVSDGEVAATTSDSAASAATRVLQGCTGISILAALLTGSGIFFALY